MLARSRCTNMIPDTAQTNWAQSVCPTRTPIPAPTRDRRAGIFCPLAPPFMHIESLQWCIDATKWNGAIRGTVRPRGDLERWINTCNQRGAAGRGAIASFSRIQTNLEAPASKLLNLATARYTSTAPLPAIRQIVLPFELAGTL